MARFKDIEALYIHIPFCNHICTYCDFYKMIATPEKKKQYIEYLIKELDLKKNYLNNIKTIYIGGGTPTCLDNDLLEYLLLNIKKSINLDQIIEFSIEANPLDLTIDKCQLLKKYHISRVSIGAQSFNNKRLQFLGRTHFQSDIKVAIKNLRNVSINNINLDLIYGLPNDNFRIIKKDLKEAIKLKINHISSYALILEEHTILYNKYIKGEFKELDGDKEAKIYYKTNKFLKRHAFNHYEISNYAKKNHQSIHNLTYWNNEYYLGIGASSSYYLDNIRYTNIHNLKKYYEGIDNKELIYFEKIKLSNIDQMKEEFILGLRKTEGINIINFNYKFGMTIDDVFGDIIKDLIKNKLLVLTKNHYLKIPEKKLFISNAILEKFI